ncbi:hypothetical protein CAP40_01510 [Sphingomonas sp. IBVSS2]|nr:hypothetical protein CAP40_01510 [Sphingomonas sp. IBVSS2]
MTGARRLVEVVELFVRHDVLTEQVGGHFSGVSMGVHPIEALEMKYFVSQAAMVGTPEQWRNALRVCDVFQPSGYDQAYPLAEPSWQKIFYFVANVVEAIDYHDQ